MSIDADFAELYAATRPRLVRTAYVVTGDAALAEDALQTAFVQAYRSWARVSRADDPIAYVRRMVVNAAIAQTRKPHWRRERLTDLLPEQQRGTAVEATGADEVWEAVQRLAPRQRAVVVLRYYEGLSEREIADALGCSPGTVKSQASNALTRLRERLAQAPVVTEGAS